MLDIETIANISRFPLEFIFKSQFYVPILFPVIRFTIVPPVLKRQSAVLNRLWRTWRDIGNVSNLHNPDGLQHDGYWFKKVTDPFGQRLQHVANGCDDVVEEN